MVYPTHQLAVGGKGGVAFLWRHNLDKYITILDEIGNDRIIALKLQLSKENILFIIAVYLPTSTESSTTFKLILDALDEIICKFEQEGSVLVVGDFNAHIGNLRGSRSSTSMNRRGMNLYDCLGKYDLVSVNSQALYLLKHFMQMKGWSRLRWTISLFNKRTFR